MNRKTIFNSSSVHHVPGTDLTGFVSGVHEIVLSINGKLVVVTGGEDGEEVDVEVRG